MDDYAVCMAAARLIEKRGLCRFVMRGINGTHCALGALQDSGCFRVSMLADRVFGGWGHVADFNDAPDTTLRLPIGM